VLDLALVLDDKRNVAGLRDHGFGTEQKFLSDQLYRTRSTSRREGKRNDSRREHKEQRCREEHS
jgi:hypothetical protein